MTDFVFQPDTIVSTCQEFLIAYSNRSQTISFVDLSTRSVVFCQYLGIHTEVRELESNSNRNIFIEDRILHIESSTSDFVTGIYLFDVYGGIYEYSLQK